MTEINWIQACIEAPLAVCLAVLLYKCYRARMKLSFDSPCSRCCGLKFKMDMPGAMSESERTASDDSEYTPPKTRSQTAQAHGQGSENVVRESATRKTLTQGDFATAEASLEKRPTNGNRLETERCDPCEIVCCGRLETNLANR